MESETTGTQQCVHVAVELARFPHVLGEHLGHHQIKWTAGGCCVAADVRDDLLVSGGRLRKLFWCHIEQTVPEAGGGDVA